ncbi:iron(III) ABC transporter ATP-binding protein [Bacteroidia bacterium]|nr:iron(III) ABC transporter ATP-binding protein [Bacteroidia bacterium]
MNEKVPTIEIRNLSIGYKNRNREDRIADNLHSTLYSGELTCLLGANGIGKSTLLRTLAGIQPSLSGEIRLKNKPVSDYSSHELAKIIGLVLTEKVDVRDMSVTELIGLGRSPHTGFWGTISRKDKKIIDEAMRQVNITALAQRSIHALSDGERQKTMIAKVLAQQTPVIFLDEPTAFLDFPSKVEIMQLLHRLSRETGKTIFLSTHDLDLSLQMADKLWLMDKNRGITVGTPDNLSENGVLENFFTGNGVLFDKQLHLFRINKQLQ